MPELTPESAREIVTTYEDLRTATAAEDPLGMHPAERFASEAAARGLADEGFDWTRWEPVRTGAISDPDFIAGASAQTLRQIATAHFRIERFSGGHLEAAYEAGVFAQIVSRLRELAERGEV